MASVYISSTFEDLQDFRRKVATSIRRLEHQDVAMEYYVAEDTRPLERCLRDVAACDVYVGIFAHRYGFIPEENNSSRLSITELEYRKACDSEKPCLIFLMSEEAPWPKSKMDKGAAAERIEAFRDRLSKRHSVNFFTTEDELALKIGEALAHWQQSGVASNIRQRTDWDGYRRAVFDWHQWVRMQVIAGVSKDRGPMRIPLTNIFEPQLVAAGTSGTDVPDDVRKYQEAIYGIKAEPEDDESSDGSPLAAPEEAEVAELAGDESVLLASNPEFIVDVVGREHAQVILGGPGTGKSTILHYAMLRVCQTGRESDALPPHLSDQPIPFLIELRNYALQKKSSFIEYIVHSLRSMYDTVIDVDTLTGVLDQPQRSLVFFDGLDEVFDPDDRKRVINEFQTFARRHPQARIVVTSRIAGYERTALGTAGFEHYTLLPLSLSQIRRFADNWYRYYTLVGTDRTALGLVQRIVESPRMLDLAGNPLLLTMMAVVYKDRDLPNERWRLYQRCAETLLEDWELGKGIEIEDFKLAVEIRTEQKSEILQRVSMFMLEHAQAGKQINAIDYASLMREVAGYLEEMYKLSPGEAAAVAVDILKHLMEHTYVLAGIGERVFGFVHRTFMEYFAACHCIAKFNARKSDFSWITKGIFGAHWRDGVWEEVLLLLIAMLQGQGTPIRDIVDGIRRGRTTVPLRLAFAARCLGEAGHVQDPAYAHELLGELANAIADHVLAAKKTFTNFGLKGFASLAPAIGSNATVDAAVGRLTHSKSAPARMVAWQMGFALRSHKERLGYALASLSDRAETVRRGAIAALEREWPGRPELGKHLVEVVRVDRSAIVRLAALAVLNRSWRAEPGILDVLADRAEQERGHRNTIRYMRFLSSAWHGHSRARDLVLDLAGQTSRGRDLVGDDILVAAGEALAEGWKGDSVALAFLTSVVVRSDTPQTRSRLATCIGKGWQGSDALAFLKDLAAHDRDGDVRGNALIAIANGWRGDAALSPFIQSCATAEENDEARQGAVSALVKGWHDDPQTKAFLLDAARSAANVQFRKIALRAIAGRWAGVPELTRFVQDRAIADPAPECRGEALMGLGENSMGERDVLQFIIERFIEEPDPIAKHAAGFALGSALELNFWNQGWMVTSIASRITSPSAAIRQGALTVVQILISSWRFRHFHRDASLLDAIFDSVQQLARDDPDASVRTLAGETMEQVHQMLMDR